MSRLDENAKGVFIIAVTPFRENGALDLESTDRVVEFYLDRGADGLTILGMMGEAPKLTAEEAQTFARHVIRRVAGRVPVVVGVSSPGFAAMHELAVAVTDAGAAGVMVAPPPTLKTDEAVAGYFQAVQEILGDIPFVLQDYPLSTGVHLAPSVIERIVGACPGCVMLKHEDWPGLGKISALRSASGAGRMRRIPVLVGNGGIFLPEELGRGADGAMTGFAYPEMMVDVCAAHARGEADRASDLFDAYLPLARYEQQPNIGLALRKHVLARRGAIGTPAMRRPHATLAPLDLAELERLIARQERYLQEIA